MMICTQKSQKNTQKNVQHNRMQSQKRLNTETQLVYEGTSPNGDVTPPKQFKSPLRNANDYMYKGIKVCQT